MNSTSKEERRKTIIPTRCDAAHIVIGLYCGLCGYIDSIADDLIWIIVPNDSNDNQLEDPDFASLGSTMVYIRISLIISTPASNTLKFMKEKGYDVGVGNIVRITRGHYWGHHSEQDSLE